MEDQKNFGTPADLENAIKNGLVTGKYDDIRTKSVLDLEIKNVIFENGIIRNISLSGSVFSNCTFKNFIFENVCLEACMFESCTLDELRIIP